MNEQLFRLPDLGEGLTGADVLTWLVQVGDTVEVDQPIVEVETAKVAVEVPSPYAGTVVHLHAEAGNSLAVGAPLITIGARQPGSNGRVPDAGHPDAQRYREEEMAGSGAVLVGYGTKDTATKTRRRRPRTAGASTPAAEPHEPAPQRRAVPLVISPIVRNHAREHGVDLTTVEPTGQGGVITRKDVQSVIDARSPAQSPTAEESATTGQRRVPLSSFRRAVSESLSRSRSEIPEATVWVDVDATPLWELRESTRASGGPGLMSYIARFVVSALKAYPVLNSRLDTERDEIVEFDHVNLGIAVQGERGLVVPAVRDAHLLTTTELDEAIRALTTRALEGGTTPEELTGGTFTLNNYGAFRVDGSAAIINHPQVAILGIGRMIDRPWVIDGQIAARKIAQISFVFDHRVCDGATAAAFMRHVADAMENPLTALAHL